MYFMSINLSAFRYADFHEREIEGSMEKCISIPIKQNGIVINKKGRPFIYAMIKERKPNKRGDLYLVIPYIKDKATFSYLLKTGWWKKMYYLGNITKSKYKNDYNFYRTNKTIPLDDALEID